MRMPLSLTVFVCVKYIQFCFMLMHSLSLCMRVDGSSRSGRNVAEVACL